MNNTKNVLRLGQILCRQINQSSVRNSSEVVSGKFQKMKEVQKRFGVEDNTPVYLKGGLGDKVLFSATCLLTAVGLAMCGDLCWQLTFGKKE